jgi:hypothetical protein
MNEKEEKKIIKSFCIFPWLWAKSASNAKKIGVSLSTYIAMALIEKDNRMQGE